MSSFAARCRRLNAPLCMLVPALLMAACEGESTPPGVVIEVVPGKDCSALIGKQSKTLLDSAPASPTPREGSGGTLGAAGAAGVSLVLPVAVEPWVPSPACQDKVADLLSRMTLADKAGQMVEADSKEVTPAQATQCRLGSVLSGGTSDPPGGDGKDAWVELVDPFHQAGFSFGIPILYGVDAVHGHNNVSGAVIFPHNIGLGCTRNPELVEQTARITALEMRGTGMDWTFSPVIAAALDERWGRTYESFSEDPTLAAEMGLAMVRGLQGTSLDDPRSVLATAKHFAGDGATDGGDDQGNSTLDEATFRRVALDQYQPLINAGVGSIMVSYSSYEGLKMTGHEHLLTEVLKGEMGFRGLLITDWGAVQQLPGGAGSAPTPAQIAAAVNAGIDMIMEPARFGDVVMAIYNGPAATGALHIEEARIDDAVTRILGIKCELGMFAEGYQPATNAALTAEIGSVEHREVARQAVRESLVLLKNEGSVLPLPKDAKVIVAGSGADSLQRQCGGWTLDWQGLGIDRSAPGGTGAATTGTTLLAGIRAAIGEQNVAFSADASSIPSDAAYGIVVLSEPAYAEGEGDRADLSLAAVTAADVAALDKLAAAGIPVVAVLVSGRPLIITEHLDKAAAWVAAWLPGTEGDGVADVLFGDHAPSGKLGHSWPNAMEQIPVNVGDTDYATDAPLYPFGHGLTYSAPASGG